MPISGPKFFFTNFTKFKLFNLISNKIEFFKLPLQPNLNVSGGGGQPLKQQKNISKQSWVQYIEYSDQHLGAVHSILCNKDVKFVEMATIILICMMTLAIKVQDSQADGGPGQDYQEAE